MTTTDGRSKLRKGGKELLIPTQALILGFRIELQEIEAQGWSLNPGRYVGVAPVEVDEDFDFEQTMRDIHIELADLNLEAVELAAKIQKNFEEMGI